MTASQRVLVTGSAGFIGRHVARACASRGDTVVGIGRPASDGSTAAQIGVSCWKSADISSGELQNIDFCPDIIVHCAGDSSVAASFDDPESGIARNVNAARAVLDFAREQAHPPRVVVLSSAAVYGAVSRLPIAEDAVVHPMSPYGLGKVAVEQLCRDYGDTHHVSIVLLRLFSVYGEGQRKLLFWDACVKFTAGESEFGGTGQERRDWLHIDDAVALIMHASTHASPNVPVMNGGSGRSLTVADALGRLRAAWRGPLPALRFTGLAREGDPPGYEADITRAAAVGWSPRVKFEDGIAAYAAWAQKVLT